MANNDDLLRKLADAVSELTKTIKQQKRPMAERNTAASRLGRGGKANADKIRGSVEDMSAMMDSMKEIHNAAKSGSASIGSFMKAVKNSVDPLAKTFDNLDKVVDKITQSQSKREAEYAEAMRDHIKAQEGNIDAVEEVMKKYGEYVALLNDLAAFQKSKNRDEAAIQKALEKELELREELNKKGINDPSGKGIFKKDVASDAMKKYIEFLGKETKKRLGKESLAELGKELDATNKQFKAMNDVTSEFTKSIQKLQKSMEDSFKEHAAAFGKNFIEAAKKDGARLPSIIQSRLQSGFTSNEYIDSVRMGLTPEQLNEFRSNNRDILSAMGGFKPGNNLMLEDQVRMRADELKQVGLTGQDATNYLTQAMRTAYNTGRTYDENTSKQMLDSAMRIQQAFGGTINEAAGKIQDYSSQVYNIQKFNAAASDQERAVLEKELATRVLLTKYMGYDIEYLKQQEQMRHNAQFGDIGDRIRGAIMGQVSANSLQSQLGWTDQETEVWAKSRRPGAKLTDDEYQTLLKLNSDVATQKRGYEEEASKGDVGNYIGALTPHYADERFMQMSGGDTLQGITDSDTRAQAQRNARGDISFDDYTAAITQGVEKQVNSINVFEQSVMEFSETVKGMSGLPGVGMLGAVSSFAGGVVGQLAINAITKGALGKIFKGGKGGGLGKIIGGFGGPKGPGGGGGIGGFVKSGASKAGGLFSKLGTGTKSAVSGAGNLLGNLGTKAKGLGTATAQTATKAAPFLKTIADTSKGALSTIGTGVKAAATTVGNTVGKIIPKSMGGIFGKTAAKAAGETAAKAGGKSLAKKIPGLGLAAGLGFAGARLYDGDALGATMETASGAASTIPVLGTAASLGIDASLLGRDLIKGAVSPEAGKWVDFAYTAAINPALAVSQLAMEKIQANSVNPNKLTGAVDNASNIARDENGNVISTEKSAQSEQIGLLQKLVNLISEQNGMVADGNQIAKDSQDQATAANVNRVSVQQHVDNLAKSIGDQFAMPT